MYDNNTVFLFTNNCFYILNFVASMTFQCLILMILTITKYSLTPFERTRFKGISQLMA